MNTLGDLTVNGAAWITGNLTAPNVYTKDETNDKLAERQLNITTPSVSGAVNVFGGNTAYPLKGGMGANVYMGTGFVTIDGPWNSETSYSTSGAIQMLNITRKELKSLKAGTNVSISDDAQIVTISAPNVYTKTETETALALTAIKADVLHKN